MYSSCFLSVMESPRDSLNRLYREISGPSTKRKRPDLSSRVPFIAFSAARLKAAWAFSKSSPRLMPSMLANPSWPGLSRPSTPFFSDASKQDVDARHEAGHDGRESGMAAILRGSSLSRRAPQDDVQSTLFAPFALSAST